MVGALLIVNIVQSSFEHFEFERPMENSVKFRARNINALTLKWRWRDAGLCVRQG